MQRSGRIDQGPGVYLPRPTFRRAAIVNQARQNSGPCARTHEPNRVYTQSVAEARAGRTKPAPTEPAKPGVRLDLALLLNWRISIFPPAPWLQRGIDYAHV